MNTDKVVLGGKQYVRTERSDGQRQYGVERVGECYQLLDARHA
jgi:hypothetical protein